MNYPQLDHYNGRVIEAVEVGAEDWQWIIRLKGGVIIHNTDVSRTEAPIDVIGMAIAMVTVGEMSTIIHVGHSGPSGVDASREIQLTPTQYAISEPGATSENYPQRTPELEGLPGIYATPEEQKERLADGPEIHPNDLEKIDAVAMDEDEAVDLAADDDEEASEASE